MVPILWYQFLGHPENSSDLRWFKDYIMLICGLAVSRVGLPDFQSRNTGDFYCAMHVVLARYCYRKSFVRPSVRLSVRRTVTLMYADHIGWTSSKVIARVISIGSSLLGAITSATCIM